MRASQFGKGSPAQQDGQHERAGAKCADAAVAHDFQHLFTRLTAAEAVYRVGEPVFVEAAGYGHGCSQRQRGGWSGGQAAPVGETKNQPADQRDRPAGNRRRPDRLRQAAAFKIEIRQRQTCEEGEATAGVADDCLTESHCSALAMAWKNAPETWPRRPPKAPNGAP